MSLTSEKQILGMLLVNRELMDRVDLDKSFFRTDKQRLIFDEISKGAADAGVVASRIRKRSPKFDDVSTYISDCMEGVPRMTPVGLQQIINDVKKERLRLQIADEVKKKFLDHDKIQKLYAKIAQLDVTDNGTKPESLKALSEKPILPRDHIVKPLIAKDEVAVVSSFPKIGKTILALNIAIKAAKAEPWIAFTSAKKRTTLIFQHELSEAALKERIMTMTSNEKNTGFLELIHHHKERNLLVTKKPGFQRISDMIEEVKPDLVIFDSLIDFHDKKETSSEEMTEVMSAFKHLALNHNVAILIVHHFAKITEGREGGYLARGSSVISAASDANWQLNRLHRERYNFDTDEDYFKTVELSFESRHCEVLQPNTLKMNPQLWFEPSDVRCKTQTDYSMILDIIQKAGGSIPRADLKQKYMKSKRCGSWAFEKSLEEAFQTYPIDESPIKGARGGAKLVFLQKPPG